MAADAAGEEEAAPGRNRRAAVLQQRGSVLQNGRSGQTTYKRAPMEAVGGECGDDTEDGDGGDDVVAGGDDPDGADDADADEAKGS